MYYLISGSLFVKQSNSCIASTSVNTHVEFLCLARLRRRNQRGCSSSNFRQCNRYAFSSFIRFPPSILTLRGNDNTVLPGRYDEERYLAASPSAGLNYSLPKQNASSVPYCPCRLLRKLASPFLLGQYLSIQRGAPSLHKRRDKCKHRFFSGLLENF